VAGREEHPRGSAKASQDSTLSSSYVEICSFQEDTWAICGEEWEQKGPPTMSLCKPRNSKFEPGFPGHFERRVHNRK
jgi:hypothetical protein